MTEIERKIAALSQAMEQDARRAFLAAVARITSTAQIAAIVRHLEAGDVAAAIAALQIDPRVFAPLDDIIAGAYLAGGRAAVAALPRVTDPFPGPGCSSGSTPAHRGPKPGPGAKSGG